MRGKGPLLSDSASFAGITPAYAGKSYSRLWRSDWYEDHPRLCGEKAFHDTASHAEAGSPPPMRGKGVSRHQKPKKSGITPACAGKRAA